MPLPLEITLVILGVILWVFFLFNLIAALGGWWSLAARYRFHGIFEGTRRRFCSGRLGRWCNYNNCLTIGTNAEGLYLAMPGLFRPGHPPLFIPWSDVTAKPVGRWLWKGLEMRFAQTPNVAFWVPERLGRQIAQDANRSWAQQEMPNI